MMGDVGIGIQGNGEAKLPEGFFSLSIEQERLAQEPMLRGIGWLLVDSQLQLADSAAVVFLRHEGAREGGIALVAVRISEIVADGSFLWGEVFGFTILRDGLIEFAVPVQDQAKIAVSFPESRPKLNGVTIGARRGNQPSISL